MGAPAGAEDAVYAGGGGWLAGGEPLWGSGVLLSADGAGGRAPKGRSLVLCRRDARAGRHRARLRVLRRRPGRGRTDGHRVGPDAVPRARPAGLAGAPRAPVSINAVFGHLRPAGAEPDLLNAVGARARRSSTFKGNVKGTVPFFSSLGWPRVIPNGAVALGAAACGPRNRTTRHEGSPRSTTDKYVWGVAGGSPPPVRHRSDAVPGPRSWCRWSSVGSASPPTSRWAPSLGRTMVDRLDLRQVARNHLRGHRCAGDRRRLRLPPTFLLGPGLIVAAGFTLLGVGLYRAFGGQRGEDPGAGGPADHARLGLWPRCRGLRGRAGGRGFVAALGGRVAVAVISIVAGLGRSPPGCSAGRMAHPPPWCSWCRSRSCRPPIWTCAAASATASTARPRSPTWARVPARHGPDGPRPAQHGVPAGHTQLNVRVGSGEARVGVPARRVRRDRRADRRRRRGPPARVGDGADIDIEEPVRGSSGANWW